MSDVGGFYLGFGLILTWAARTLVRDLVRASCAGFALTQCAHFLYHALHLEPFTFAQGTLQTVGLTPGVALPLVVLYLTRAGALSARVPPFGRRPR
jgi:hypothetical protein